MEKVLIVTSSGESGEEYRITINPMNVSYVQTRHALVLRGGRNLYEVFVSFCGDGSMQLFLDSIDLKALETAVGTYGFDD